MNDGFMNLVLRQYLKRIGVPSDQIDPLLNLFQNVRYKKDEYFAFKGQVSDKLGFVIQGLFVMTTDHEQGHEFVKDFLPEQSFLLGTFEPHQKNEVYLRATENSVILEASYEAVRKIIKGNNDLSVLAEGGMQKRYLALCNRLEQMATCEAAERYQLFKQAYGSLEKRIPQYLIASYLGITPTQLSRIRKKAH